MMWKVRAHPLFGNDLKELDKTERSILRKVLEKIRENPERYKQLKHLPSCYSVRIKHLRLIYYLEGDTIFLVIVGKRKTVYKEMGKRMER